MAKNVSPVFEDQTFGATDTLITGEEPAMGHFFYPLSLYKCKNTAVNKCHLHSEKEGKVLPYEGWKALHNHPTVVKVEGGNHCLFWSIV